MISIEAIAYMNAARLADRPRWRPGLRRCRGPGMPRRPRLRAARGAAGRTARPL
ncbi:hypothetical protein ACU686_24855 [Yinghuangia aomiensis]